jgi:opacity protein-like surface antigen
MKFLKMSSILTLAACGLFFGAAVSADSSALILKAGSFTLSDADQRIGGINLTFEKNSSSELGGEFEWRRSDGAAFGIEILNYNNDWKSGIGTSGDNNTLALMFNAKRYFSATKSVLPFIGGGVGFASTEFSGPGGSASGDDLALQILAGIEVRGKQAGFYTEVKKLVSKPEDEFGDDIDVSGTGVFVGVSIFF